LLAEKHLGKVAFIAFVYLLKEVQEQVVLLQVQTDFACTDFLITAFTRYLLLVVSFKKHSIKNIYYPPLIMAITQSDVNKYARTVEDCYNTLV
jgi:hypothetical protein